jgi:hypothetical protein
MRRGLIIRAIRGPERVAHQRQRVLPANRLVRVRRRVVSQRLGQPPCINMRRPACQFTTLIPAVIHQG